MEIAILVLMALAHHPYAYQEEWCSYIANHKPSGPGEILQGIPEPDYCKIIGSISQISIITARLNSILENCQVLKCLE